MNCKPDTVLYSHRSKWKCSSSKLLAKSNISPWIFARNICLADKRDSWQKIYEKEDIEFKFSSSDSKQNDYCRTTADKEVSLYTCPEILDSHHSSLRYKSGQIAISMHCNLQYS